MLILGHVGITIGLAAIAEGVTKSLKGGNSSLNVNFYLVALGSMLPDIIDKPLGHAVLRETLNNGRIISHTLVFAALLWVVAFFALKAGMNWPLAVAFGSLTHLALDEMWLKPATLFWPFLGWEFPYSDKNFFAGLLQNLDKPKVFIPEIIGGLILILFLSGRWRWLEGTEYRRQETGDRIVVACIKSEPKTKI